MTPKQEFFIGERVRYTLPREPCLRDVPDSRLTAVGIIASIGLQLGEIIYGLRLESSVLSSYDWRVMASQTDRLKRLDKAAE